MFNIEEIICCPLCKGDLTVDFTYLQHKIPKRKLRFYYCPKCDNKFSFVDSVLDFSTNTPKKISLAQKMMESNNIVQKYEGKSWRGSRLFASYTGITLKEEMALIKEISHIDQDDTVLDLACGTGLYTRYFAKKCDQRKVIGIDISWPMLRYAVNKINEQQIENITFLHGDAHYLPFKADSIDAVVCCGSLHLFNEVNQVVKEISRVIKPYGHLAISIFYTKSNLFSKLKAYLRERIWGIHSFSEQEIKNLMQEEGFKPEIFHKWGFWMIANGKKCY